MYQGAALDKDISHNQVLDRHVFVAFWAWRDSTSCELGNHLCRCTSLLSTPLQLHLTSHAVICHVVKRSLLVHTLLHHLQSSTFWLNVNFKMQNVGCFNFTGPSTLSLQCFGICYQQWSCEVYLKFPSFMLTYELPHQRNIWVTNITSHSSIKRL